MAQGKDVNGAGVGRPTTVLLVDDDPLVRAGLRMILSGAEDVEVVAECDDGVDVVAEVERSRPRVVLMDIRMPGVDGITATARLRGLPDPPAVIVLTTFSADSYVVTRCAPEPTVSCSRTHRRRRSCRRCIWWPTEGRCSRPRSPVPSSATSARSDDADRLTRAEGALARLSEREREVAVEVGAGRSNAEIAGRLFMSEATVKAHISRLLTKLGLSNRVQIALLVHDAGLR